MVDGREREAASTRFVPTRRRPIWLIRHECAVRPITGCPTPSCRPAYGSRHRLVPDPTASASSGESIGGAASRDAIASLSPAGRSAMRCAIAATCWPTRSRTAGRGSGGADASSSVLTPELLAQRDVLEDQFVMAAAGQRERADTQQDRLQHAPIVSCAACNINRHRGGWRFGERQRVLTFEARPLAVRQSDRWASARRAGSRACYARIPVSV